MIKVQVAAAEVVGQALAGKNLDRVLDQVATRGEALTAGERAAVHSISFDTLRHYGLIHAQLDTLLTAPVNDAGVRHLMLVALAQLQFSKASDHAIVDHAVSACEVMGFHRAKPLVNAVLRNFLRAPDKFKRERFKVETALYDFPKWWIERLKREQPQHWQRILLSAREHPPMWLRVNARQSNAEKYLLELARLGMAARAVGSHAVLLEKPVPVNELPGFREGVVSVQDLGAQLAAPLLGVGKGMRVLDACAAPGGKTGHLAELADIHLTAVDSDKYRLQRVNDNLRRLKLKAHVKHANLTELDTWWDKKRFDRILLDVPCSGSGVVRRHPDIKWGRRETDLGSFARQQAHLLENAWNCLAVGGRLLYVTCSVFQMENQDVVTAFLKQHPAAKSVPTVLSGADAALLPDLVEGQLLPDEHHDGFYFALLEKQA